MKVLFVQLTFTIEGLLPFVLFFRDFPNEGREDGDMQQEPIEQICRKP